MISYLKNWYNWFLEQTPDQKNRQEIWITCKELSWDLWVHFHPANQS
jgi:hypothetical protein